MVENQLNHSSHLHKEYKKGKGVCPYLRLTELGKDICHVFANFNDFNFRFEVGCTFKFQHTPENLLRCKFFLIYLDNLIYLSH